MLYLSRTLALALALALASVACTSSSAAPEGAADPGALSAAPDPAGRPFRLTGTTEAVTSSTVLVPRLSGGAFTPLVVTRVVPPGSMVKTGDVLIEFDPQSQQKAVVDRRAEYEDLAAQVARKAAEHEGVRTKDLADIELAEHAVSRAKLDMLKNEMLSAIDAEKNEQALAEAEATLAMQRKVFDLKRVSERAERRALEIQRDRAQASLRHTERNVALMVIRSRQDGLVVFKTYWKGGQMGEVQEGEEVRPGLPLIEVVDPSRMQVRARVNQLDVRHLRAGLPATITLDAYPGKRFTGRLERLSPAGATSALSPRIRTFVALISIEGQDPALLPDLSAAIDVHVEQEVTGRSGRSGSSNSQGDQGDQGDQKGQKGKP